MSRNWIFLSLLMSVFLCLGRPSNALSQVGAPSEPDQVDPLAASAEITSTDPSSTTSVLDSPAEIKPLSPVVPEPGLAALTGAPGIIRAASLVDSPDVGSGLRLGGFSGLVSLDRAGTTFLTITDRGPNQELGSGKSRKLVFPQPDFSPSIVKLKRVDDQLRVVDRIPLKLPARFVDPRTGGQAVSGLATAERDEAPWTRGGRDRLPFDSYGVDSEGLALDSHDGSFWVCEEYGPSILHVAPDGTILVRLVPAGLEVDAPGEDIRPLLPTELLRRKPNRGFEGIALSPDGTRLFALMQSPLSSPDKATGEASRSLRLIALDVTVAGGPRVIAEYVYLTESASAVGGDQDHVVIGDLAAISTTRLLVAERDNQQGGGHKMVYGIDIGQATNLLGHEPGGAKTLEQMSESDLRRAGIGVVEKWPVANLAAAGYRPEKLEGLAIIDDRTIAAINDNDFDFVDFDAAGRAIPSGVDSRLVLFRLEQPLR